MRYMRMEGRGPEAKQAVKLDAVGSGVTRISIPFRVLFGIVFYLFEINWGLDNLYFPREVTDLAHWSDGLEPTNPLISHSVTTSSECCASPDTKLQ